MYRHTYCYVVCSVLLSAIIIIIICTIRHDGFGWFGFGWSRCLGFQEKLSNLFIPFLLLIGGIMTCRLVEKPCTKCPNKSGKYSLTILFQLSVEDFDSKRFIHYVYSIKYQHCLRSKFRYNDTIKKKH